MPDFAGVRSPICWKCSHRQFVAHPLELNFERDLRELELARLLTDATRADSDEYDRALISFV